MRRTNKNNHTKHYAVKRENVENAINGLCFGFPNGGVEEELPGTKVYTGPDHINKKFRGMYFYHLPNRYYSGVEIQYDRLGQLPKETKEFPHLKVIDMNDVEEEEKGPAPKQFEVPFSFSDESITASGITLPIEPKDADVELQSIIQKVGWEGYGTVYCSW